jgi:hypothetical protein
MLQTIEAMDGLASQNSSSVYMPPGPAFNWLCVLLTTAEILAYIE